MAVTPMSPVRSWGRGDYGLGTPYRSPGAWPLPSLAGLLQLGVSRVWAPRCGDGACPPLPKEPTSVLHFPSPGLGRFRLICTRASQQTLICNKTTMCAREKGFQTQKNPDTHIHSHTHTHTHLVQVQQYMRETSPKYKIIHSFNVVWSHCLQKEKPASWTGSQLAGSLGTAPASWACAWQHSASVPPTPDAHRTHISNLLAGPFVTVYMLHCSTFD